MPRYAAAVSAALAALALATAPSRLQAQGATLSAEARAGVAVPLASFADGSSVGEGTGAGSAFGVEVALRPGQGRRTLYAGFSQLRFGCKAAGCPAGEPYVATGVNAGLRLTLLPGHRVLPWVGVGALTTRVESPGVRGSPPGVSTLGYGGEISAGLYLGAGRSVAFTPSVRFVRAGTELPGGASLSLRYLVADLGVVLAF
ncbi:MAG: hypothetical protein Q8N53_18310 [Longimicrobiales bacterium]|nr:hypothetical protein [Longimicrobiales bacterium]